VAYRAVSTVPVVYAQARDPIPTFRKWALEQGLLSDGKVKEIEAAVTAEVEDSVKFADESPKPVSFRLFPASCLSASMQLSSLSRWVSMVHRMSACQQRCRFQNTYTRAECTGRA
jgi:TPP-dependent pyruvate/acetoin dehydrogenase alpha subunit